MMRLWHSGSSSENGEEVVVYIGNETWSTSRRLRKTRVRGEEAEDFMAINIGKIKNVLRAYGLPG
jgi:hypothetical protein